MTSPSAPYGLLDAPSFPVPGLAALVGRQPLGGPRETALACLLCARLALATLPPYGLSPAARQARAAATAAWLRALPLTAELHAATAALCAAAATPAASLAERAGDLLAHADPQLDHASRAELRALATRLGAGPP